MAYHMTGYLCFFLPAAVLLYQLFPKKHRWLVLLLASIGFVLFFSRRLAVWTAAACAVTWADGLCLDALLRRRKAALSEAAKEEKKQIRARCAIGLKLVLAAGILAILGMLAALKYANFFGEALFALRHLFTGTGTFSPRWLAVPMGISYYSLEMCGYLADIYWEKSQAERNPLRLVLVLLFFPKLMEGPICLYGETAPKLFAGEPIIGENLARGTLRIFWGLFKKMVVADRLNTFVGTVFAADARYEGIVIAAAAVCYTIQLYMEFSGTMDIILGSGTLFGITLPENFRQPFLAKSAAEFWRRWHITLGIWLKTYVFYPVSISGVSKKFSRFAKDRKLGTYLSKLGLSALALFPVWFANGLWHGPHWNYLFYGLYYFVILLAELALEPLGHAFYQKCGLSEEGAAVKAIRLIRTWGIICIGELFFRAETLSDGFRMFAAMFRSVPLSALGMVQGKGPMLSTADWIAVLAGSAVVCLFDLWTEKHGSVYEHLKSQKTALRWSAAVCLILAVFVFGAYGAGYSPVDLIYAGF